MTSSNNELEHERAVGNNEQIHRSKSLANLEKYRGSFFNSPNVHPSLELHVFKHLWSRSDAPCTSIR